MIFCSHFDAGSLFCRETLVYFLKTVKAGVPIEKAFKDFYRIALFGNMFIYIFKVYRAEDA